MPKNQPQTLEPAGPVGGSVAKLENETVVEDVARWRLLPSSSTARSSAQTSAPHDTFIPESVDQLLAHSRRYPLLTPQQEIDLAKRIERGDLHARELMINSNLRLVASNARRYQNQGLPLGDLVQEGMLGLIRASEKFDWRNGFPLLDIRNPLDPPSDPARARELGPHHPSPRPRRPAFAQGRTCRAVSFPCELGREQAIEELSSRGRGLPISQPSRGGAPPARRARLA